MRGKLTLALLRVMKDAAIGGADLFEVFLEAGYGASVGKMEYLLRQRKRRRVRDTMKYEQEARERRKYHNLLSYLRRHRLINEEEKGKKKKFWITAVGIRKLLRLEERNRRVPVTEAYEAKKSESFVIVIFDIPEREKWKREWLRAALRRLGLRRIQKSVWMGKVKIPKEFLDDIRKLQLLECVEIFEASRLESVGDRLKQKEKD